MTRFVEQVNVLDETMMRLRAEQVGEPRIAQRRDVDGGAARTVIVGPLEQRNELESPIVHSNECPVFMDRPRDRMTGDVEVGLNVAQQLERIFPNAVAFVDERENRNA